MAHFKAKAWGFTILPKKFEKIAKPAKKWWLFENADFQLRTEYSILNFHPTLTKYGPPESKGLGIYEFTKNVWKNSQTRQKVADFQLRIEYSAPNQNKSNKKWAMRKNKFHGNIST